MTERKNSGVELWERAKKIIPGGNQLLSKRAEMFLPDKWPAYYSKVKGSNVWTLMEIDIWTCQSPELAPVH